MRKNAPLGFAAAIGREDSSRARDLVEQQLKRTFRPEFLNRIDETIVFDPLTPEQIAQIVDFQLGDLRKRLEDREVELEPTPAAKGWLAREGLDPNYGARPLRRRIQRGIENPLAKRLLAGEFAEGDTIVIDAGPMRLQTVWPRRRNRRLAAAQMPEFRGVISVTHRQ